MINKNNIITVQMKFDGVLQTSRIHFLRQSAARYREISSAIFEWPHPVHRLGPGNLSVNPVNTDFGCRIYAVFKNYEYGPVTMIAPASGHQVRCIPWVQMGTFNKEIGFLCGLKKSLRWIYFVRNTYNRVYIWCCKYCGNHCCERCANK